MANSLSTSIEVRKEIVRFSAMDWCKRQIAEVLHISVPCVKKRLQAYRRYGEKSLVPQSCRPKSEPSHQMSREIRVLILKIKRKHRSWGAQFILAELRRRGVEKLPHRHTIERFLAHYPSLAPQGKKARRNFTLGKRATGLHEEWQVDYKGPVSIEGVGSTQIMSIRDNGTAMTIGIFPLPPGHKTPTMQETLNLTRGAFAQWGVLPDRYRTDNGGCFVGNGPDPFPSRFSLYLWGMGVEHQLISPRCPKQNGGVERSHRTLDEHLLVELKDVSVNQLPTILTDFRDFENHYLPSRSAVCKGKTAIEALKDLPVKGRPYNPQAEKETFDINMIYQQLSTLHWKRKVDPKGEVALGDNTYYLGVAWRFQNVEATFDPDTKEIVFRTISGNLLKRIPVKKLSYERIVGEVPPT